MVMATSDPTATAQGRSALATLGVNTLGAGAATDASAPDPYQSIIEAQKYLRDQSDKQYKIQLAALKQQSAQIAVQQGQAEANAWYQRQEVELAKAKMQQDQGQFDQTQAELKRQFDQTAAEKSKEFDLTSAEGQRQYNLSLQENQRQFNSAQAQHASEFASTQAEQQREFNTTSSGYDANGDSTLARQQFESQATGTYNGQPTEAAREFNATSSGYDQYGNPTLDREKFGNQALFDWTKQAVDLASTPLDWVKEKRLTSGVAANAGQIPGLDMYSGAQVGNTTQTDPSQANSLQHVLGTMGMVNEPQMNDPNYRAGVFEFLQDNPGHTVADAISWMNSKPTGDSNRQGAIAQGIAHGLQNGFNGRSAPAAPAAAADPMQDPNFRAGVYEFVRDNPGYSVADGVAWMNSKPPDDSNRQGAIAQGLAHGLQQAPSPGGAAPAAPTGQAAYGQGVAAGMPAHAADNAITNGQQVYAGGSSSFNEGAPAGPTPASASPTGGGASNVYPMNWALQAAGMINGGQPANMSADEQQIYDTANQFATNPQGSQPGWWESQDPSTKQLIQGAAEAQGHDWSTVMARYNRAQWGGGGSAMAA
jgi:hypothetical protein